MSTKITAIEYMFRLQGCFEDDTIYLQTCRTSSGVY
nr:MAG TPA: hypothetical protein [Caudoviricetes sp.]